MQLVENLLAEWKRETMKSIKYHLVFYVMVLLSGLIGLQIIIQQVGEKWAVLDIPSSLRHQER